MDPKNPFSRRDLMRAFSLCAGAAAVSSCVGELPGARARPAASKQALTTNPKFLIVISATGGASIVDSFLAVRASQTGANAATLNAYPDTTVNTPTGSAFNAVKFMSSGLGSIPFPVSTDQSAFVQKHFNEMLVATSIGTSVNHVVAQKRSLTGNAAWKGRTLQECMALQYGANVPLPNVNMGFGGYLERGDDDSLPGYCYGESVGNPALWPLGLDGVRGVAGAPKRSLVQLARNVRDQHLDLESTFATTFQNSPALKRWYQQRAAGASALEPMDLVTKLNMLPDSPPKIPLAQYGLASSPDAAMLDQVFPNFLTDTFEAQAAAAYLLLKNRVSVAITIGPNFNVILENNTLGNPPLAFDFSHQDHRAAQAFMWNRVLSVTDRLIDLLKAAPYDQTSGQTLWDNSLIYIATDFGRTKTRPANATSFGAGHDLHNGFVMLSPLVKGNTVLGGVDPTDLSSYAFDSESGVADRMTPAAQRLSNEKVIFAGVAHTLGIDTTGSGLPDCRAFRKGA